MNKVDPAIALPREIFHRVLSYCKFDSWSRLQLVSKSWRDALIDPHLWAVSIDSDALRVGARSTFNAGILKKCLELVFLNTKIKKLKHLRLRPLDSYSIEKCLQLLDKRTFAYSGKSIDRLAIYFTGEHSLRANGPVFHLIPVKKLLISSKGELGNLETILDSQHDTLKSLRVVVSTLGWTQPQNNPPLYLSIISLHLEFDSYTSSSTIGCLFQRCPKLKHLAIVSRGEESVDVAKICEASSESALASLQIKEHPNHTDSRPSVEQAPEWPKHLKKLVLMGVVEQKIQGISGSLENLEYLQFGLTDMELGNFLRRFGCGKSLRHLRLSQTPRTRLPVKFTIRDIEMCPNIEQLLVKYSNINDNDIRRILVHCSNLRRANIGHTLVSEQSLIRMAKHGIKVMGIAGLYVQSKTVRKLYELGVIHIFDRSCR